MAGSTLSWPSAAATTSANWSPSGCPPSRDRKMKYALVLMALSISAGAQNYTAEKTSDHGVDIVRLTDAAQGVEVSIVPSIGNRLYEMKVHGKNILYFPDSDLAAFQKKPGL